MVLGLLAGLLLGLLLQPRVAAQVLPVACSIPSPRPDGPHVRCAPCARCLLVLLAAWLVSWLVDGSLLTCLQQFRLGYRLSGYITCDELYVRFPFPPPQCTHLTPNERAPSCRGYKMGLTLLLSTLVFQVSHACEAEPLLACVTMGMFLANR